MTDVITYSRVVALDAIGTRDRLMQAGLRLFAEHGVHGAQMRDVVREAGQANDSAVHYHFGSRNGLLLAICDHYVAAMEPQRQVGATVLADAVADLVDPT